MVCCAVCVALALRAVVVSPEFKLGTKINPTAVHIQRAMKAMEESTAERPATVRVMFYGQSIVAQGWRKYLQKMLEEKYPTVKFEFECRAIGGFESPRLAKTAWSDLYPFYPDLLFFHVYGPMDKYEEIVRNMRAMTTAEIVLWSSHLYKGENPAKKLANRDNRTKAIRSIAERNKCMFVDLNRKWCEMLVSNGLEAASMLSDNVHMNGKTDAFRYYAGFIGEDMRRIPGASGEPEASGTVTEIPAVPGDCVKIGKDGTMTLTFSGNRVVAVSDGRGFRPEKGTPQVEGELFLDGRPVASYPEMWHCTRPSALVSWMPMMFRARFAAPPVKEDWTLTFIEGTDPWGDPVHFRVDGSVTGFDGEGWSTNDFRSASGRAAIEKEDFFIAWQYEYFVKRHLAKDPGRIGSAAKPGRKIRWKTLPLFALPFAAAPAGTRSVLVQNCKNGRHTLEIRPKSPGGAIPGIGRFIVHSPAAVQVAYAELWRNACASNAVYAPIAGIAYANALERAGRNQEASKVRKSAADMARPLLRPEILGENVAPAAVFSIPPHGRAVVALHVATWGDDAADGSEDSPFASLERARDEVRKIKRGGRLPAGGVAICIHGGTYRVDKTLELGAEDSGEPGAPVVWRAWRNERPVLTGAIDVPRFDAKPDPAVLARIPREARAHVVCADLRALGFADASPMPPCGFYCGEVGGGSPMTDVYADGARLELARWPDDGWLVVSNVVDGAGERSFKVDFDLKPWAEEPSLMLTGYWRRFWADYTCAPARVDPKSGVIALGRGEPRCHVEGGHPWFILNAARALSRPGEWWLDRSAGRLYLWPPAGCRRISVSRFDGPFFELKGVRHFAIAGIVMEHGRWMALKGTDCSDFRFAGNVVRGFGGEGIVLLGSRNAYIGGNVMRGFGMGALRVSGGDRRTLESSGVVISGNDVSWTALWKRTYAPGLHLSGCGTEVAYNRFHDMRSSAIRLEGNDHHIVSNIVERVVTESDDQGGLDIYANPAYAGNFIAFNVWRDIGCGGRFAPCGQGGVRLDDAVSTTTVYCNLFENCSWRIFGCVQINGGRNNVVDNNVFVTSSKGVSVGGWTDRRWRNYLNSPGTRRQIEEITPIRKPPYSVKYPGITRLLENGPVNYLTRNVVVGGGAVFSGSPETIAYANRRFGAMPSAERLAEDPAFRPLPRESDLGPRDTAAFRRASANDSAR